MCVVTLCIIYIHLYHTHFVYILLLCFQKDILCWKKSICHQLLTVYVEMYHPHFILNSFYLFSERYAFILLIKDLHWIFYMVNMQCRSFIFSKNYKPPTSHNFFSSPKTPWLGQQPKKNLTVTRAPTLPIPVPLSAPFRHPSPLILIVPLRTTTPVWRTTRNHQNHRNHQNRQRHVLANRILSVPASVLQQNGPFKNQAWRCLRLQKRKIRLVVGVLPPIWIWAMRRVLMVVSAVLRKWQSLGEDPKVSNFYECDVSFKNSFIIWILPKIFTLHIFYIQNCMNCMFFLQIAFEFHFS